MQPEVKVSRLKEQTRVPDDVADVLRPSRSLGVWDNTFPFLVETEVDFL